MKGVFITEKISEKTQFLKKLTGKCLKEKLISKYSTVSAWNVEDLALKEGKIFKELLDHKIDIALLSKTKNNLEATLDSGI